MYWCGVADGTLAMVSRYIGAGEREKASIVSGQATVLSLLVSILTAVLGLYLSPKIFQLLGTEPLVSGLGTTYLRIIFCAAPFIFFWEFFFAIFKASGDTETPMLVTLIAICGNILLDPLLIFGIGPFPEMGTSPWRAFLNADSLSYPLVVRNFRSGDRFVPLGMRGRKKIKDFFIDLKIPSDKRAEIPILVCDDVVIWVCGLRIDDRFKITPHTKKVLRITLSEFYGV